MDSDVKFKRFAAYCEFLKIKMDQEILDKIYTYYPKNCRDEEFDSSAETVLKLAAIQKLKADFKMKWEGVIHSMEDKLIKPSLYSHLTIVDQSAIYDRQFCNYITYSTNNGGLHIRMHLLVSLLHPLHTILVSVFHMSEKEPPVISDYTEITNYIDIDSIQKELIENKAVIINNLVTQSLGTKQIKMIDLKNEIVPYIELEVPDTGVQNRKNGEVTLFDCLFTNFFIIY